MEGASCSIQAELSQHLDSFASEVMLKFALALGPRFPRTQTLSGQKSKDLDNS